MSADLTFGQSSHEPGPTEPRPRSVPAAIQENASRLVTSIVDRLIAGDSPRDTGPFGRLVNLIIGSALTRNLIGSNLAFVASLIVGVVGCVRTCVDLAEPVGRTSVVFLLVHGACGGLGVTATALMGRRRRSP